MVTSEKIDKRFLEESFPIKEVSIESTKEKGIRKGHISTLHIWWARRPLASSRAANYAALIPISNNPSEMSKETRFIVELSKWSNSLNNSLIEKAKKNILEANNGVPPKVLDPFSGGGSIPLEALRLGCETYASDYNPVAVFLLKCTLEYPQKFSGMIKTPAERSVSLVDDVSRNCLLTDVQKWGEWILRETQKEIGRFYPSDKDGSIQTCYLWARTIPCQNPSCGAIIPLMRQYWLARKANKEVSLFPYVVGKKVEFKIVGSGYEKMPSGFDPDKGTVSKAVVRCPVCGSTIDSKNLKNLFKDGKAGERQVAIVLHEDQKRGKKYRVATIEDEAIFAESEDCLEEKKKRLLTKWGMNPIPDERTPDGRGRGAERAFSIRNYNMNVWGDLHNSRQKLALVTFVEKVRDAYAKMLKAETEKNYARAVTSYLAIEVDKIASSSNSISRWQPNGEKIADAFSRQALPIVWDYPETNILYGGSRSFTEMFKDIINVISFAAGSSTPASINQSSATVLPYSDNFFDAVFTDPPYYDNVPYSHLSDFFYVWLKRSVGELYPELFSTPLTPKSKEIVAYSNGEGGWEGGKKFFEDMLKKSFVEINRVLKPNGIAIIIYAHKSTSGWETLVNSLLDSGLVITAAWPIHTEMRARLRAQESAALSSSIYIVARKLQKVKIGVYKDVKEELQDFLCKKMDLLWKEGVSGADFLISAIGASVMVFGKYEQILRENSVVRADVMLEDVRRIVTDYAVKQVLHNGFAAEISNLTRFYLLWRWSYGGAIMPFDDARKLSQSTLIDLSHEWSKSNGVIRKQKENVCLLGPQERSIDEIIALEKKDLIDVLHMALLLWQKGDREALVDLLSETGFGNKDSFYRVAQAISETLPKESQEKKLIEGFLAGKERLSSETKKINVQKRLFE
jgi:adenine-specific DNA methylase